MHVVYVCSLFKQKNSSAAIRNVSLVKGLVNNGHRVTVLTTFCKDGIDNVIWREVDCEIIEFKIHNNHVKNAGSSLEKLSSQFSIIKRVKNFLKPILFFPDTHKKFVDVIDCKEVDDCDLIISSSDTKSSHYAGLKLKNKFDKVKWVQVWGDPWSDDVGLPKWLKSYVKTKEFDLLEKCDKVFYISDLTLERSKKMFPTLSYKMVYVPRSYFRKVTSISSFDFQNVKFVYTGSLGAERDIFSFLNWCKLNLIAKNYIVDIYSSLSSEEVFKLEQFKNVKIQKVVSYDKVLNILSNADVLLFVANKLGATQIPGKFFDYLGTNLPILCIVNSIDEGVGLYLQNFPQCFIVTFDDLANDKIDNNNFLRFISNRYEANNYYDSKNVAKLLISQI